MKIQSNKRPYHQRKKELKVFLILISFFIPIIVYFSYIRYNPFHIKDIPIIRINYEGEINYETYVDGTFELENCKDSKKVEVISSKIKLRGTGTGWNRISPKKEYCIELSEPKTLLGMDEDDDWLLFALYFDYPRLRIKLSIELWRSLLPTNPTAILPDSEFVCLYVNGEFNGLYLLLEKNNRRLFNLDDAQNSIDSSLIFQAKFQNNLEIYKKDDFEQDFPNEYEGIYIMDEILMDLINFMYNLSDTNLNNGIYSKFNKQNLIDFYVFNFFILHDDFWDKNYYILRNTNPSKFFLVPWDFDRSLGSYLWDKYDAESNIEAEIRKRSKLFRMLLDNYSFREDCRNRWFEMRNTIYSEDCILGMLDEFFEEIKHIIEFDVNLWNSREPILFSEEKRNDIDKSIKYLYDWISERLEFCDKYFLSM